MRNVRTFWAAILTIALFGNLSAHADTADFSEKGAPQPERDATEKQIDFSSPRPSTSEYVDACLNKIEQNMLNKTLPPDTRGRGEFSFVILSSGKISEIKITRSSGNRALDEAVKHAIYKAGPFDPLPQQEGGVEFISVTREFEYSSPVRNRSHTIAPWLTNRPVLSR